ncbi:cytochrome C [Geoalkalibacter halelectricus]|uniref:Cytochrome C n=1 Tax=Geoalkalibacter halelectricus TaxID=2847045 RepID=A0ABY5ZT63_9BACT|nr:cytochrome C [Geoalkalibacter halelectricus]MDO3377381.1 cytochrome C [Geoalkalibacter halelectricus]UWZ80854.1 cytochrome C [Geoalkalibacter halelectricus]
MAALAISALAVVAACTLPTTEAKAPEPTVAAEPTAVPAPRAPAPAPAKDIYDVEIEPLTLAQCGQCHPTHFGQIRDEGGKHRFDCRECHEVFHAYNPRLNNWDELMPDCASCHTLPHGEKFPDCIGCHINPHTPVYIPFAQTRVADACADCHGGPATELAQYPSLHTDQACTLCHYDQHGYIPSCFECHQPHYQGQPLVTCAECHPVHMPLEMAFGDKTDTRTCQACHTTAYADWTKTPSKHGQVNCGVCHTAHPYIPTCQSCHGDPHSASLHERFPNCLTCHLNAHDLPVRRR